MKILRDSLALAPCLMLFASMAHSQNDAPKTKLYQHETFQIRVPADVEVSKKEVADFDSVSLMRNKTRLMGVYVGGHPSFPSDDAPANESATHFKLDGLDAKFLQWQDEKGRYNGETLVTINQGWARVIHFYYRDLSQQSAAQAEAVIRSVRLNPKKQGK